MQTWRKVVFTLKKTLKDLKKVDREERNKVWGSFSSVLKEPIIIILCLVVEAWPKYNPSFSFEH